MFVVRTRLSLLENIHGDAAGTGTVALPVGSELRWRALQKTYNLVKKVNNNGKTQLGI